VSDATYERIKGQYRCTPRGRRAIKHGTEVETYFIDESIDG